MSQSWPRLPSGVGSQLAVDHLLEVDGEVNMLHVLEAAQIVKGAPLVGVCDAKACVQVLQAVAASLLYHRPRLRSGLGHEQRRRRCGILGNLRRLVPNLIHL